MTEDLLMTDELLTVGQVAGALGVTVRSLHHHDEIGLVLPSERSSAGYRLYTARDLRRLQHVVVYRRLGFPLYRIGELLADDADVAEHLRRQRRKVTDQVAEAEDGWGGRSAGGSTTALERCTRASPGRTRPTRGTRRPHEELAPGLARYVHDAVVANPARG